MHFRPFPCEHRKPRSTACSHYSAFQTREWLIFLPSLALFLGLANHQSQKYAEAEGAFLHSIALNFSFFTSLLLLVEYKPWHLWVYRRGIATEDLKKYEGEVISSEDEEQNTYMVKRLPFTLHPGECVGIFGSRSDTSPLLSDLISAFYLPCFSRATEICYCPREDSLHPVLSAHENFKVIAEIAGRPAIKHSSIVDATRFKSKPRRPYASLSTTDKRRACVAAAILSKSPVLVFDQPTDGVDVKTRYFTWKAISAAKRSGRAILITTSSAEECEIMCDRVAVAYLGRVIALNTPSELKRRYGKFVVIQIYPATPYDVGKIIRSIEETFPRASAIPSLSSSELVLRWKVEIPDSATVSHYQNILKQLLMSLPIRECCVIRAPLDIIAEDLRIASRQRKNDE